MTLISMLPANAGRYTNAVAGAAGLQARILWCDAEANVFDLASKEQVADLVKRCEEANLTTIVVDVKPLSGFVLYNSRIAPKLSTWKGKPYPADYDLLATMVEEGHKAGLEVYAAMNVFSEGVINRDNTATAFTHPDWQAIRYEIDRIVRGSTGNQFSVTYVNKQPFEGRMAIINDPKAVPSEVPMGTKSVSVDASGTVTSVVSDAVSELPAGGYILTGMGEAGQWLAANAAPGLKLILDGKTRLIPVSKSADEHLAVFVNPANPEVRTYELSIIGEIITNYDVDGVVLDRMRYPGMYADFSDLSRQGFEAWIGEKVQKFPEEIFTIDPIPGKGVIQGKYFGKWMEWRAKQIRDFVVDARKVVKDVKPKAKLAAYVGSWYSVYYDVGVNWASPEHTPPYGFASPTYRCTGYADLMDWICTGCYYEHPTRADAKAAGVSESASVEAACQESNNVVKDDTFVYGSLYLLQYSKHPETFQKAMDICTTYTQGVMLFDLVYLRNYDWWNVLKSEFPSHVRAPHEVPCLIEKIKDVKKTVEGK